MTTNGRTYALQVFDSLDRVYTGCVYAAMTDKKRTAIRFGRTYLLAGRGMAMTVYMNDDAPGQNRASHSQIYQAHLSPTTGKIIVEDIGR